MVTVPPTPDAVAYLRQPQAIRDRAGQLFTLAQQDRLPHLTLDLDPLDEVVTYVQETTEAAYPDWAVPFHSRWRNFAVGGGVALGELEAQWAGYDPEDGVRSRLDLAIISVLLDAGAGSQWRYQDLATGEVWGRSEGLAIASLRAFQQGLFSSDPTHPLQVDGPALVALTMEQLATAFQVGSENSPHNTPKNPPNNPLVGLSGRLTLLHQLGQVLHQAPHRFGSPRPRPGHLWDHWQASYGSTLRAGTLLTEVLTSFGAIWPGRITLGGTNLGDVWPHPALPPEPLGANLIPFHKLSQWLTYSLVEPLEAAGMTITHLDDLTGLAEYRNGGLCLDFGLIRPRDPQILTQTHRPDSPVVVEWRALTVILLDHIAQRLRDRLGQTPTTLPLVKILEGGTWAAGRRIAQQRRPDGSPPLRLDSDGTVF